MRKRLSLLSVLALALGALAGLPAGASAKHGADDPAGHVRRGRGADDGVAHARSARRAAPRTRRRGADDPAGHVRRGRGADDAPNHG